MVRARRRKPDQEIVVCEQPGGLLVAGDAAGVDAVVDQITHLSVSPTRVIRWMGDAGTAATTAWTAVAEHGTFVKLTPRSLELLKQYGATNTANGSFWGVVRNGKGIAKHLDFEKVAMGPSQALSLQTLAVSMALRAAIADVQAAVERVEGKVDDVLTLIRADRVGDVLGTRRVLASLVERVERDGVISSTDWSSVASAGAETARTIQALREHLRVALRDVDVAWRPAERAKSSEQLLADQGLLRESLALLVVAEHNLAAWHALRIAHVAANEPEHLEFTIEDARRALAAEDQDDQALLYAVTDVAEQLTTPSSTDGLFPWQRRALGEARAGLDSLATWFAAERLLDRKRLAEAPYPTVKESLAHVTRTVEDLAGRASAAVRRRPKPDGPDALDRYVEPPAIDPPGEDP